MSRPKTAAHSRRTLSEAEAWRKIARRLSAPRYRMPFGLCYEAWLICGCRSGNLFAAMSHRIDKHIALYADCYPWTDGSRSSYAFKPGECREERILAALFLALEAEDEALR